MKIGHIVMIIDKDPYTGSAAEIIEVLDTLYRVKIRDTSETLLLPAENLKRKKLCVCGLSKSYPFCDGSHAGGN